MSLPDSSRRSFLRGAAVAAAVVPFSGTLQALSARNAHAGPRGERGGRGLANVYGPLAPALDQATGLPLLQLPEGFEYRSLSWTGDLMENGQPVPARHDGMGVVGGDGNGDDAFILVRNHENGLGPAIGAAGFYDRGNLGGVPIGGGTTNLYVPRGVGRPVRTVPSLGGTLTNCAGGVTPWGTWLTCEETTTDARPLGGLKHGYVFEVTQDPARTTGQPIVDMGRFAHEAAAVDPATGIVYLTEDSRNVSLYYRFLPHDRRGAPGSLARGGVLQAARVKGVFQANLNAPTEGDVFELEWVNIGNPDQDPAGGASGPFNQGRAVGAFLMSRGEGIWFSNGKMYVVDTAAGLDGLGRPGRGEGCVWEHDLASDTLRCIFQSTGSDEANNPDNITVSPSGQILAFEDGGLSTDVFGDGARILGILPDGEVYIFAKNNVNLELAQILGAGKAVPPGDYRSSEFCGGCFDPSGHFLFVNVQSPGITFQIWGPWARGGF